MVCHYDQLDDTLLWVISLWMSGVNSRTWVLMRFLYGLFRPWGDISLVSLTFNGPLNCHALRLFLEFILCFLMFFVHDVLSAPCIYNIIPSFFSNRSLVHIENEFHRRQMQGQHERASPHHPRNSTASPRHPRNSTASPRHPRNSTAAPRHPPIGNSSSSNGSTPPFNSTSAKKINGAIIAGAIGGTLVILMSIISIYICKINKASVKPWATGLSGQLQKAFVTGKSYFLVK